MATKAELEATIKDLERSWSIAKRPKRKRPAKRPAKPTIAQRIADLEARVDELEAYEATDEYGQKIYPPNPNSAWADSRRLFEKARQAWADRNGKELRRRQVASGQPPR